MMRLWKKPKKPQHCPECTLEKYLKHIGRYEYTALEAESNSHELERKSRERAHSACLQYLKFCPRYGLVQHLNDIGSRVDKHWFVVRDTSVKTERLLTLTPRSIQCVINNDSETRKSIMDLFLALQHPYIYPVLDLEFVEDAGRDRAYNILVIPFNSKGSLKDLIYKSCWHNDWADKYGRRSDGLPLSQVQRLGRQILEALVFLKERGFPPCCHLHTGNIILQNGVARLSGLENALMGYTSRIQPMICKSHHVIADSNSTDIICFGHVLFEMSAGYELTTPHPNSENLHDIAHYPQVAEILDMIFHQDTVPRVQDLLLLDFFRHIDLREMRTTSLPHMFQAKLTPAALKLLSIATKHNTDFLENEDGETESNTKEDEDEFEVEDDEEEEEVDDEYCMESKSMRSKDGDGISTKKALKEEHRSLSLHTLDQQQMFIPLSVQPISAR
ncbi:hypothetical protein WDU94_004212 [Cyamophila willieti]